MNDENVRVFNTPVKGTKMTWNSPFQSLQPQPQQQPHNYSADTFDNFFSENPDCLMATLPSEFTADNLLNNRQNQIKTDIPVLDDLFTELNSDLQSNGIIGGSEPVNLEDIERILLQPHTTKKPAIRQPFTSILNSFSNESLLNLPTGPFDDQSPMLFDGTTTVNNNNNSSNNNTSLIPLNPQLSTSASSKIQVKVIGKRSREPHSDHIPSVTGTTGTRRIPYIPAPTNVKKVEKTYRTYGKKRYVIGPEYADFVCRLQNDIPFDSSEEEDEEIVDHSDGLTGTAENYEEDLDDEDEEDEDDFDEFDNERKISPQELLELFEDSCSGLPGLISAFLTHRKHQIGLKGYRSGSSAISTKTASAPPLLSQNHFDRIQAQLKLHFQFLIQNLALANEIEGGEGVTLLSLKLLVQLHLHLDSICNFTTKTTKTTSNTSNTSNQGTSQTQTTSISCLNLPTPRVNPIKSRLSELIPPGIRKVSIIAGFLIRPGQKQFLSLSALRLDSSLKPRTSPTSPPLAFKIKFFPQSSGQLLSNAFYNILALFHDYIDSRLLEQTISVQNLSKYLEMSGNESTRTAKFLASEDNLLLCGLHRFGCGNWESIQSQFLPYRTARQLAIRYKNLSSRREPMNPIKEFNERLMMPLSDIEEDLLCKGVQRFGNQFHLISKHYLPHRPATVLGKLWKAMDDNRNT